LTDIKRTSSQVDIYLITRAILCHKIRLSMAWRTELTLSSKISQEKSWTCH